MGPERRDWARKEGLAAYCAHSHMPCFCLCPTRRSINQLSSGSDGLATVTETGIRMDEMGRIGGGWE